MKFLRSAVSQQCFPSKRPLKKVLRISLRKKVGDVTTLNAIAEEIKTHSDSCVPLSIKIVQMAEDFEFNEILKLADELDTS